MDKTLGWLAPCGFHSSQELIDAAAQVAKERDDLKAKCEALEAGLGAVNRALKAHLDDADALLEQRDALKAKVQELERELSINVAANNEQFQLIGELQAKCEALEKALRDALPLIEEIGTTGVENTSVIRGAAKWVEANAALAGGKEAT